MKHFLDFIGIFITLVGVVGIVGFPFLFQAIADDDNYDAPFLGLIVGVVTLALGMFIAILGANMA